MFRKLLGTKSLCMSAVIAALYAALTLVLAPISYGSIQCRISEALTLLPIVTPTAIPGLFVGCILANILGGCSVWDIVFGSLATLLAACGTYALRQKTVLAAFCPVIANGVIVGAVLSAVWGLPLWLTMAEVAVGEAAAVLVGCALLPAMKKVDLNRFL